MRTPETSGRTRLRVIRLLIVASLLGLWEAGVRAKAIDPFFFPAPSAVAGHVLGWLAGGEIWLHIGVTLLETVLAFLLGVGGGIALGVWLGLSPAAAALLDPFVKGLNAIPRMLLAPIFALWFGLGLLSKVVFGAVILFFISFSNTFQGVREANPVVLANARLLGATRGQLLRHVYLPSAASWILSSLRVSIGFAVSGAVVAEYLGSTMGLGHLIAEAEGSFDAVGVFAGMTLLVAFVLALDGAVSRLERRLLAWSPNSRREARS